MKIRKQRLNTHLLTITIIGIVIFSMGCSFAIGFNIKNLSDQTITVRYSLKDIGDGLSPRLTAESPEKNTNYLPIPEDRISIDTKKGVVEFKLLPDENVVLFWVADKLDNSYEKEFNIANLRITGVDGSIALDGHDVFKSFRPIKKSWYAFGPETTGFVLEYR